jgi:ankyrin repeat protein
MQQIKQKKRVKTVKKKEETKRDMQIIRYNDSRCMAELVASYIAASLKACLPQKPFRVSALKKRVVFVKPRSTFQSYVETRSFHKLLKILKNDRCNFNSWLPNSTTDAKGQSALHLLVQYNPSVDVVDALLLRMKRSSTETNPQQLQDIYGRTPLHIAITRSCDTRVIELLVFGNGILCGEENGASIMDYDQRYPLHYICLKPTQNQSNLSINGSNETLECILRIVRCLIVTFPKAVDSPDKFGWTPKSLAEALGADEKILHSLQQLKGLAQDAKANAIQPVSDIKVNIHPIDVIEYPRYCDSTGVDHEFADDVSSIGWNVDLGKSKNMYSRSMAIVKPSCSDTLSMTDSQIYIDQYSKRATQVFRFL